jgi:hypothetical protein
VSATRTMNIRFLLLALLALAIHSSLSVSFRDPGWWSVIWAPDGKSIFCQDLENIWLIDIPSGKATRLTPKMSYASDSCWLNHSEYLLVDSKKNEKISSIYQASIGSGTPRRVIKNAANPSVSAGSP